MLHIALIALLGAQQPSTAPATVEGVVVKAGTREPLAGARIQLERERSDVLRREQNETPPAPGAPPPPIPEFHFSATTGPDGRFLIEKLPPGEYRLYATRTGGYVPGEYGQRSPTGRGISFQLGPGEKKTDILLSLTPTGSISGRVYDRDGEPAGKATVQALRPYYRDGRRALTIVQSVATNDRGEYRLFWLPPGRYYVTAKSGDELNARQIRITEPARFVTFEQASAPLVRSRTLPTGEVIEETQLAVYYPGTTDVSGASPIDLRSGGSADGIDIAAASGPVRTRHIRGVVTDPAIGRPVVQAQVLAIPRTSDPSFAIPSDQSRPDGSFDIAGVAPGSYVLFASSRGLTAAVPLQVGDANIDNVVMALTGGFQISGRVVVEGQPRNGVGGSVSSLRVFLQRDPDILGMPPGGPEFSPPPAADGSFAMHGVPAGDFRVTLSVPGAMQPPGSPARSAFQLPDDMYVKSMRFGTTDVLDGGLRVPGSSRDQLEVVIGANAGRINGTVVNASRDPLPGITVVAVPDGGDRSRISRYKQVASDASGRFQVKGLAPGNYSLFAFDDIDEGAWLDPEVIRPYENRGTAVRVRDGSDENVQLTVISR
jgi:carboxypeptidase family protein